MGKRILVVGGVAGGASFAARMRRLDENAEIVIFEKGDYISFANCGLPYHVGKVIKDRSRLIIQTPDSFRRRFNVKVRIRTEVIGVDPAGHTITVRSGDKTEIEEFDCLVLSPGAQPLRPPIPGIGSSRILCLRSIPDMDRIVELLKGREKGRATVVGGGFIGLEMAENLRQLGLKVSLVEMADQVFLPSDPEMAEMLHAHLRDNGVELLLGDGVSSFQSGDDAGDGVTVVTRSGRGLPSDLVILAIGVKPDTAFLEGSGIERNPQGAIRVNAGMETNCPEVYALGDAAEITDFVSGEKAVIPLAGPANRQGRIVADRIAGIPTKYKQTQGTSICKIFDLTAAVTGINERRARESGIGFVKSYTHGLNHAEYYPGAVLMSAKVLFDSQSKKILGAQVIGKDGVDKRIDVFATAIRHGLTAREISELELAYAPPYGSAKDPVNIAGFVGENILEGRMPVFYAEEVDGRDANISVLLDVRTPKEAKKGAIPGSKLIPIDDLRGRLGELDRDKEIYVYCQVGLRGHYATRILLGHGFRARNLSGGFKTYALFKAANPT